MRDPTDSLSFIAFALKYFAGFQFTASDPAPRFRAPEEREHISCATIPCILRNDGSESPAVNVCVCECFCVCTYIYVYIYIYIYIYIHTHTETDTDTHTHTHTHTQIHANIRIHRLTSWCTAHLLPKAP
jgi:hypothetical protein